MNGVRIVGRGLHDTFENLAYMVIATVSWWLAQALIVTGPPATIALFIHADPRHGTLTDRPGVQETLQIMRDNFGRGWKLFLIEAPVVAIVLYNIGYYGGSTSAVGLLAPLWIAVLIVSVGINGTSFALAALDSRPAWDSFKAAFSLVGSRLPTMLGILLLLAVIIPIGTFLVVPAAFFLPATIAAIFNRFVLTSLDVTIPDPLAPTAERSSEATRRRFFG